MAFEQKTKSDGWNKVILGMGGGFLQSWEWGEFQKKTGKDVLRLMELFSGAHAQLIKMPLPLAKGYWYCPQGPVFTDQGEEVLHAFEAEELIRDGIFLRFEPVKQIDSKDIEKVRSVQPSQTSILDITKDSGELMAEMKEKTRYNIRLAEKKGVTVFPASVDEDGLEVFWQLLGETTKRGGFRGHGREYYKQLLETLKGDPADKEEKAKARLLFAEHDGKVLAAILLIYFGDRVTYLHGSSSREKRELMAPHLVHWRAIEEAKSWGYKEYDFWGVAPEGEKDHPWAGITRFKNGFGGKYIEHPGTFDLPLNTFWYKLYSIVRKLKK